MPRTIIWLLIPYNPLIRPCFLGGVSFLGGWLPVDSNLPKKMMNKPNPSISRGKNRRVLWRPWMNFAGSFSFFWGCETSKPKKNHVFFFRDVFFCLIFFHGGHDINLTKILCFQNGPINQLEDVLNPSF